MVMPTFDPGFSTPAMTSLFSTEARIRKMLDFESALAQAEEEVGIVPRDTAATIARVCEELVLDPERVLVEGWEAGTPVMVVVDEIRQRAGEEAAPWVHFGSTTQDVVDTVLMLQLKEGIRLLRADLAVIALQLRDLVVVHRFTPMMGRTLLQKAEPTSFGWRAAQWLAAVAHHIEEIETIRTPAVQLGGPVGNLAALGDKAVAVMEGLARRLNLSVPISSWHTDRSPITEVLSLLVRISSSMAKVGVDLALLSQTEIGEVRTRPGGSSSMPHKQNPIDPVQAMAAAQMSTAIAQSIIGGPPHHLDRAAGGWHAELLAIPMVFHTTAAAVSAVVRCLQSLQIDVERMRLNLGSLDPTEALAATQTFIDRILIHYESSTTRSGFRPAIGN
jgi:3-carboxy-cis,cis-muconate cycloisomerase